MSDALPQVTAILADIGLDPDFSMVLPSVLDAARARGVAVHQAIEAIAYGYFDESELPLDAAPYLDAYRKFISESGYAATISEIEVAHDLWRYRGHIDSVGLLRGHRAVIDWKAVASLNRTAVGYQLAGYHAAWNASRPTEPAQIAAAVQLRADGTYRFYEIDVNASLPGFLAAVTVWYAKRAA